MKQECDRPGCDKELDDNLMIEQSLYKKWFCGIVCLLKWRAENVE